MVMFQCFLLTWGPLFNLVIIPPAIFVILSALTKTHDPSKDVRPWKQVCIYSFILLAISYIGFAIVSTQYRPCG